MNDFADTLISGKRHDVIPEGYDYFAPLIGKWSFKWHDNIGTENESNNEGIWTFSRVLEGRGVQDTFVTSKINPRTGKHEQEYGTTVRLYNPLNRNWDIFYGCTGEAVLLVANREGDEIVLTCTSPVNLMMKWIFYDIRNDTFSWKNIVSFDNGKNWVTKARAEDVCRIL